MPKTRSSGTAPSKKGKNTTAHLSGKTARLDPGTKSNATGGKEDAYDKLLRQVKENRRKRGESDSVTATPKKMARVNRDKTPKPVNAGSAIVRFEEDDNFFEMEVTGNDQRRYFPTPSEEEDNDQSDKEDGEIREESLNNNVSRFEPNRENTVRAERSQSASPRTATLERPGFLDEGPGTSTRAFTTQQNNISAKSDLSQTMALMQNFYAEKGAD